MTDLPEEFREFVHLFGEGAYWESHEALEDRWRATGSDFYQGLIIYASAFVHARRDNPNGIVAQLEKALGYLEPYPEAYHGLDVAALRRHAERCLELVRERRERTSQGAAAGGDSPGEEGRSTPAWEEVLPTPRLDPDPGLVRGDEPELGPTPPPGSAS